MSLGVYRPGIEWSMLAYHANMHAHFKRQNLQKSRDATMMKDTGTREVKRMAPSQDSKDFGYGRNVYPALTIAALAGIALTTYLFMKKSRESESVLPVEKVVNLCNSAAEKLDAFVQQSLAS